MSTSSTMMSERRRQALERMSAQRQRPDRGSNRKPMGPPSTSFYVIAFIVTGLTMLGLVMVFSASAITSFHRGNSPWRLFNRQLIWAVCGGAAMIVAAKVPYYKWRRFAGALLSVTLSGRSDSSRLSFSKLASSSTGRMFWPAVAMTCRSFGQP